MINLISAFLSLFNVNYFLGFIKNGVFPLKLDENEENEGELEHATKFGASPPSFTAENPVVFSEHHHPKTLKTL